MLRNFGLIKSDCCWQARSLAERRNVLLHAACRAGGFETWHRVVYTELLLTLKVSCTFMTRMWSYLCGNIFVFCAASGPIGSTGGAKGVRCLVRWPRHRLAETCAARLFCPSASSRGEHGAVSCSVVEIAVAKKCEGLP